MSTLAPTTGGRGEVPADLRRGAIPARRRALDLTMKILMWVAVFVAAVPLAFVTYHTITKGWTPLTTNFPNFLTGERIAISPTTPLDSPRSSMGPAIVGTILTVGIASALAIPLGLLGAIYLNEYGKNSPLARIIRTMADVMTGVPSIVMGLFIYLIIVVPHVINKDTGLSALGGALALGCLMLPLIVRSSEEMLKLVPDELRQASLALGARRWRTTLTVVLPAAISGLVSGALLAIARAAGETAPVVLVMGLIYKTTWDPTTDNISLPTQIWGNAGLAYPESQARAWGAALVLIAIVLITTLIARIITSRFAIKER